MNAPGRLVHHFTELPCAAAPFKSYRYRGRYGWVMIGAHDDADALQQAARAAFEPVMLDKLQRWNGIAYEDATS